MHASWKANWRLCSGLYLPLGSCCLNQQQLVASSLSFYLYMYICTLSKPQVTDMSQVAQFSYMYFTHKTSVALIHVPLSQVNIKEWGQVLQHLVDMSQNFAILGLHSGGIWMEPHWVSRLIDTKSPKYVSCISGHQGMPSHRTWAISHFCCVNKWNNELGYGN